MIINCIAIDDEPLALGLVTSFIKQTPFLHLLGVYKSGKEALKQINIKHVQVVFMDIKMPKMNGIEIARLMRQEDSSLSPKVVFTTAYDQFAIESYRVDAMDYLLKPFSYDDFLRAAKKALAFYNQVQLPGTVEQDQQEIFVRVDYQNVRIACNEILYIEGLRDYVKIYLVNSDVPVTTLATLKSLQDKLPPNNFMRVQRSFIVSLSKVSAHSKTSLWIGDIEISVGDRYKDALNEFFSKND